MTLVNTETGEVTDPLLARIRKAQFATSVGNRVADDSHVYFIQQGFGGPIKIGRAVDVLARLRALQTANPIELRILGVCIYGGPRMEARLHRMFAADRLAGEWFRPSQLLYEVVGDLGVAA